MAFPQSVRFQLFAFDEPSPDNLAIEVTEVERLEGNSAAAGDELSLSLRLTREQATDEPIVVPVQIHLGGAVSQVELELVGKEVELKGYRIPIDDGCRQRVGTSFHPRGHQHCRRHVLFRI